VTYRSRKLLDLAHEAPCFADYAHKCGEYEGCEPAHSDSHIFGRGHGHKSNDFAFASMCHEAHMLLDKMEREEKFFAWLRAYAKTQNWLWVNGLIKVVK
jgi:hypothetical protein